MLDYTKAEITAGAFLLIGLGLLGYLSISIGGFRLLRTENQHVRAQFSNIGDLKARAPVKLAGVTVGKVDSIRLVDYRGEVDMAIDRALVLPQDTIASISTAGLLGDAFVSLSPGASDRDLKPGDRITHTEPAINVADLLARFAFGGQSSNPPSDNSDGASPAPTPAAAPRAPAHKGNE